VNPARGAAHRERQRVNAEQRQIKLLLLRALSPLIALSLADRRNLSLRAVFVKGKTDLIRLIN
jgi:hypothetical protein